MSTLHTISKAPSSRLLESCLAIAQPGDAILLIEDGVYYSQAPEGIPEIDGIRFYCLREDVAARGLAERKSDLVESANMDGFVNLSVQHSKIMSWF